MKKKKNSKRTIVIIIIIIAVLLTLVGAFLSTKGENKKPDNKEEVKGTKIDNDDKRFFNTYSFMKDLTYQDARPEGFRSFSGKELMSIISPFFNTADFTKEGDNYTITVQRVLIYLTLYFPKDATIRADEAVDPNYVYETNLDFPEGKGMIITNYDGEKFTVKFTSLPEKEKEGPIKIFPREIESAMITPDEKTIIVTEKAIYVEEFEYEGKVYYTIYADETRKNKIDTKLYDPTEKEKLEAISIVNYREQASTITQTFKYDENSKRFIFAESKISE